MNIKSSLKSAQNLPQLLSPVHDPNLPVHADSSRLAWKSKEHAKLLVLSTLCSTYTISTHLMWACGHFLDKP